MDASEISSQSGEQCPQLSTTIASPVMDGAIPALSGEVTRVRRDVSGWQEGGRP
jgi:hypothetical protein